MTPSSPLHSLYRRVTTRRDGALTPHRASARLSAYIYGNVIALTVVAASTKTSIDDGSASVLVLGTTVTTFLAHIFAESVAAGSVQDADGNIGHELRDATPIASSGIVPAILLALAWLEILPSAAAQGVAGAVVIARVASIPIVAERLRGNGMSFRLILIGLVTAALATVVVAVKVFVGH